MNVISAVIKRELYSYFSTPIAYVFLVIFLIMSGVFTFYIGNFFVRGQADLMPFFNAHPWLFMIFIPAMTMRVWAEERKTGTIELLLTLPISNFQVVLAKFISIWLFIIFSLLLTFPVWLIVNYLGSPDNGVILASYIGSVLMAGGFIAIGSCVSCITSNQVVAFILSFLICLLFNLSGFSIVAEYLNNNLPIDVVSLLQSFSFLVHFEIISKGLLDVKSIVYFLSLISALLYANTILININKAG